MPSSGNVGFQAPSLTPPPGQDVKVETYADKAEQQQAQMPPVYYGGKTGSVAFMADKVLTGWLAGTKIAHEQKAKKMADEVGAAKTGLDYIGQAYRAAVESGDEKKIGETKAALSEAYNDYLNKAEKYALPDQKIDPKTGKPKKEGVGSKIKTALKGGENPHLNIAHSTLDIMRKTDPTQLYGPSKQEQQASEVLDLQTQQMKKDAKNQDRWEKLHQTDPKQWSKEDKQFNEWYEYMKFGRTKEQATKDDLLDKISSGAELNPQEKQLAQQFGFIKGDQTTAQIRTIQGPNGKPVSQIVPVTVGADGKVVAGQPINLPGNDYVGPNQADMAGQVINAQMSALMKWGAKMHPEWDQKTAEGKKALTTWALTTLYPPTAGTINWADKNAQMDTMNRALNAVIQKHTSKHKDPDSGQEVQVYDQLGNAIMGNVVTTSDDGRYTYMPGLAQPQETGGKQWYNPFSWGNTPTQSWNGMTREQLFDQERKFQAELRAELKKQNPKLADSEIDKMVPAPISRPQPQGQPQAMTAPPGQPGGMSQKERGQYAAGALGVFPAPPTKQGEQWYRIRMPDGSVPIRSLSPDYVEALKAQGIQVEAVE